MRLTAATVLLVFAPLGSTWADEVRLGEPKHIGNGCPLGTLVSSTSGDPRSLKIRFDRLEVLTESSNGGNPETRKCVVAIPVHVPPGVSVSAPEITVKGQASLPSGARSRVSIESFMPGGRALRSHRNFFGILNQEFQLVDAEDRSDRVWSPCGRDFMFHVVLSVHAAPSRTHEEGSAGIEELRGAGLKSRRCENEEIEAARPAARPNPHQPAQAS